MMSVTPHHCEIVEAANAEDLADRAADWLVTQLGGAGHGPVSICLSGGSTPKRLYQRLARGPWRPALPWGRLHWFWGDERVVPPEDPRSNRRMVMEALLAEVEVPDGHVHPVPVDLASPEDCALAYEGELKRHYGAGVLDPGRPLFDITLLGIGSDGHTASLFPGMKAVDETRRWAVATQAGLEPFVPRVTLTVPALAASRAVVFLVSGEDKRDPLRRILGGEPLPAAKIVAEVPTLWFVDRAALGGS